MKLPRRPWLKNTLKIAGAICLIHLASALTLDRKIQYLELSYPSPKIGEALEGYRVAFLTDIHRTSQDTLRGIVAQLNERGVDLVLFGGDFSAAGLSSALEILSEIHAPDGFYGVEGNHDNAALLSQAMGRHDMTLLENRGVHIREGLYLAGLEDLWNRDPDVEQALAGAGEDDFVLLACHNPDASMEQDYARVDLALSGHVHGGEVTFFGLWGPAMPLVSSYGQRFRQGMCASAAGTDVFVSHGVGSHSPLRVFARPQVILLTLTGEE